jgi:hypothetical protein
VSLKLDDNRKAKTEATAESPNAAARRASICREGWLLSRCMWWSVPRRKVTGRHGKKKTVASNRIARRVRPTEISLLPWSCRGCTLLSPSVFVRSGRGPSPLAALMHQPPGLGICTTGLLFCIRVHICWLGLQLLGMPPSVRSTAC